MDKNLRPYLISCDWLQLYLHKTSDFQPEVENLFGYHFQDIGHGSKVFKKIYNVIEPTGEVLGNISLDPYSSSIPAASVIFKAENNLLYQNDYVERIFMFISACGLYYKGITRMDIAYDSNVLYGGLKHETLIKKYRANEYLKIGANEYFMHCSANYHLSVNKKGKQSLTNKDPKKAKKGEENDSSRIENVQRLEEHRINSVTWGSRSSDVQVQLYDKSKELKEVKMKHYIVDAWKAAGLDTEKSVFRIEIRIQNEGKHIKNLKTGKQFSLSMNDLVTQEMLEQLFHDYARKVFRFYHRKDITHKERMKEVKVFSLTNQTILKPQRTTRKKDYTRMHKIMLNYLDKNIAENARLDNVVVRELEKVKEYFITAYGMEKWYKEREQEQEYDKMAASLSEVSIQDYYKEKFSGLKSEVAERAAKKWSEHEEAFLTMVAVVNDEDNDISPDMEYDIRQFENYYHSQYCRM